MKTVLQLACFLAVAHYAIAQCNIKEYSTELEPACSAGDVYIKWPNYPDQTKYYSCQGIKNPQLVSCPAGQYFCYVLQQCGNCSSYMPPVPCEDLRTENPPVCVPINGTSTGSPGGNGTPTPHYPTGSTTTTKTTTPRPTKATPSPGVPTGEPPTGEPPAGGPTPPTEGGNTPFPGPPTPPVTNPDVPMPPTPKPTPPNVSIEPPAPPPAPGK